VRIRGCAWILLLLAVFSDCVSIRASDVDFQGATHLMPFDEETLQYHKTEPSGPVALLQKQIERPLDPPSSAITDPRPPIPKWNFDHDFGYLPSLLQALGIPKSSQMLVFSKTSFQRERISPTTPRALFFNDTVYVGFIPGAPLLEVSMADPKLGGVFYTVEQKAGDSPRFVRNDQCLECHATSKTMGVPGHLMRSFATDEDGVVDLNNGASLVTHRTPLAERWGGWYVTGTHGKQTHRGNLFGQEAFEHQAKEPNYRGNLTDLSPFFDVSRYPSKGSDIVALMVLEHQVHMHNFITRLRDESELALHQYGHLDYLKNIVTAFLKYLLFVDEAPLTEPISGNPEFARWFEAQGPRDAQGRSLRQFDLKTRTFLYPCSYLIYSDAFDALPDPLKRLVWNRLLAVLDGKDPDPDFRKLSPQSRLAIREILQGTKHDLPQAWGSSREAQ